MITKAKEKEIKTEYPYLRGVKLANRDMTAVEIDLLDHLEKKGWDGFEAEGFVSHLFKEID